MFRTSVRSSCGARRGAWRILCFCQCILTLAQSTFTGYSMDPLKISAGNPRTRVPRLCQPAPPCPAAWLLASIHLTVTQAATVENPNWGSLCFCFFFCGKCAEDCDWNQRVCSEENKKAQGTLAGLKDFKVVYIQSFFLSPHYLGLWRTVARKHLKVERLGHCRKDTRWTGFQHQMRIFSQPAPGGCSGLPSCVGFRLILTILTQRTLWLPAIINGTDWNFQQPCLYLHILVWLKIGIFCLVLWVLCVLSLWLPRIWRKKPWNVNLYQEETTVTVWGYSKHFLSYKRRMMNLYLLLYIGEFLKSSRNSLPFRQFLLGETAKFGTLLRGICVFRVSWRLTRSNWSPRISFHHSHVHLRYKTLRRYGSPMSVQWSCSKVLRVLYFSDGLSQLSLFCCLCGRAQGYLAHLRVVTKFRSTSSFWIVGFLLFFFFLTYSFKVYLLAKKAMWQQRVLLPLWKHFLP